MRGKFAEPNDTPISFKHQISRFYSLKPTMEAPFGQPCEWRHDASLQDFWGDRTANSTSSQVAGEKFV
jgi:hypothetical protein